MNAYDLANELNACFTKADWEYVDYAVNMLRQQADRIAELEKETHSINYTCPNCETHVELFYKTPQIKELSDEEIYKLAGEFWIEGSFDDGELDYVGFARAILKKASEK